MYTGLPEPVLGLTTSTSDTSISLEWSYQSSGSSERTGVVVELWAGGVLMESVGLSRVVTSTTLSFLRPLTNYTIAVYVVSEVGRSAPITVYTTLSLSEYTGTVAIASFTSSLITACAGV